MARESQILIRLSEEEKAAFEKAAQVGGLSTSSWIRQKLRVAAMEELRAVDIQVAFLMDLAGKVPRGTTAEERQVMPVNPPYDGTAAPITSPETGSPAVGAIPEIESGGIRFTRPD